MTDLADELIFQLYAVGLDGFTREFRWHPVRRWRADVAFVDARLLIEVDGGVWIGGGHTSGAGKSRDCLKDCEALVSGWRTLRVTGEMVKSGEALRYVERALAVARMPQDRKSVLSGTLIPVSENAQK
jgi:very-short-patch-repair endonuclease